MEYYCITGGIGSGKSYVCRLLEQRGIRIYDCDSGARKLMASSESLRRQLMAVVGDDAYVDGMLNKDAMRRFLLASEENKQTINGIVHPAVMEDFRRSGMQWMESAILYEAHLEQYVDKVVAVTAPIDVRVQRVMQRDGITEGRAREWIACQMSQDIITARADYVIVNDGRTPLDEQIERIVRDCEQ